MALARYVLTANVTLTPDTVAAIVAGDRPGSATAPRSSPAP